MPETQNLPGGAPKRDLRDAIDRLAEEAREQDRLAAERTRNLLVRRPVSRFIRVGVALAVLELALLGIMYGHRQQQVMTATPRTGPAVVVKGCPAVAYKTYWQIAAFVRDQGHPPATLSDLVGKYVQDLPTDPQSGAPLVYSTDGAHFDVRCPGGGAAR